MSNKKHLSFSAAIFSAFLCAEVSAESLSVLRVYCDASDVGAKIFVNDEFKANCNADLILTPGETKLRVVKSVDEEYERVFEQDMFLGVDTAQRVNVLLSAPRLTDEAVAERTALRLQEEKEQAQMALEEAEQGNVDAMRNVATFYLEGIGLPQSQEHSTYWSELATTTENQRHFNAIEMQANAGDIDSMYELAALYTLGKGVEKSLEQASAWQKKADSITAEAALASAKAGVIADMRRVANFYNEGKGLEQNEQQAKFWNEKADAILVAEETRQKEEKRQAELENKNRNIQAKIDNVSFFEQTGSWVSDYFDSVTKEDQDGNYLMSSTMLLSFPIPTILGLLGDAVSAPTKTVEYIHLKTQLAARPSKFDNPDSMIAKAYANRQQRLE